MKKKLIDLLKDIERAEWKIRRQRNIRIRWKRMKLRGAIFGSKNKS